MFQSTPPTRGATAALLVRAETVPIACVSIHAPHAGGDRALNGTASAIGWLTATGFNPRPPTRGGDAF